MLANKKVAVLAGVAALAFAGLMAPVSQANDAPGPGDAQPFRALNNGQSQRLDSNHLDEYQPYAIAWEPNNVTSAQVWEAVPVGDGFQIKADSGECLQATGAKLGSRLAKKQCNQDNEFQLWQFEESGDIAFIRPEWSTNLRLEAPRQNAPLELRQRSSNNMNQQWIISRL
ncbi:ricin-type beta-trefoil lectin domain protein [Streptomyces roseolus]|uniref:ricin-type beta-trefoil lectin domain protein n=1 Tax=Streptomyces roseolus TaxID=67358 RepID=UPI0036F8E0A6